MTLEIGEFRFLAISAEPPETVAKKPLATKPKRTTKINTNGGEVANPRIR